MEQNLPSSIGRSTAAIRSTPYDQIAAPVRDEFADTLPQGVRSCDSQQRHGLVGILGADDDSMIITDL